MGSRKIKRHRTTRTVKMNAQTAAIIENQLQKFREKFGREPGPKDPIFFDPDAFTPQPLRLDQLQEETERAMSEAGIRPEIIYAYRKTGLIVTQENYKKLPADALAEWEVAVKEYFEMVKRKQQ
jgi:hypothetical protein